MGNNQRKELHGMNVKISDFLNAKKEAISELENQINYEERNIKESQEYIAEENEKPDEERYDWRIEEYNRRITESKLKIIFYNESIDAILNY